MEPLLVKSTIFNDVPALQVCSTWCVSPQTFQLSVFFQLKIKNFSEQIFEDTDHGNCENGKTILIVTQGDFINVANWEK